MEELHPILTVLQKETQRAVLATLIRVEGSAYRKEGASLLLLADGRTVGMISAGCLEADLAARAEELFDRPSLFESDGGREAARTVVYDLRTEDDLSYGQGAGCNGTIHVLLEPVDDRFREQLQRVKTELDRGVPVLMVRVLKADGSVSARIFQTKSRTFGDERVAIPQSLEHIWRYEQGSAPFVRKGGLLEEETTRVYWQRIWPKPRLFLFGAGPDARPLATLAQQTGFAVTVSDWRSAVCHRDYFPEVDRLVNGLPETVLKALRLTPLDSVIVMTHHFQRDREWLRLLLPRELYYLGILGPRRRTIRLLDGAAVPESLHSPVGLSLGAEGPEEIAVSIVAELIQHRRQKGVAR